MITCQCPQSAALQTIPASGCPESFGQIQKVVFQRLYKADGSKNTISKEDIAEGIRRFKEFVNELK